MLKISVLTLGEAVFCSVPTGCAWTLCLEVSGGLWVLCVGSEDRGSQAWGAGTVGPRHGEQGRTRHREKMRGGGGLARAGRGGEDLGGSKALAYGSDLDALRLAFLPS